MTVPPPGLGNNRQVGAILQVSLLWSGVVLLVPLVLLWCYLGATRGLAVIMHCRFLACRDSSYKRDRRAGK